MNDREYDLSRLEHCWKETGNALFVWEALALCLKLDPCEEPLPTFCREYLTAAASKMTALASGRDFRSDPKPIIDSETAFGLVREALGLGRSRSKNAFKRLPEIKDALIAALDEKYYGTEIAKSRIKSKRNIDDDRAKRLIATGRRLARFTKPKKPSKPKQG